MFDPNTFAAMTFNEANSTESIPVPAQEWPAIIDNKKIDTWQAKDGSSSGLKLIVNWNVTDPSVKEVTGRDKNLVKQEMMLDLTEAGMLDFGKGMNVQLGRLRAAVGLNNPGEPFSFDMLVGRQGKIQVGHRPDPTKPGVIYAEVKAVASI
jgi:hypothetical protein